MTQLTTVNAAPSRAQTAGGSDLFGRLGGIGARLTDRLKETGVVSSNLSANLESLIGGIRTFLPADRDLTITKIVESLMDPSAASSSAIAKTEHYLYFDPRSASARGTLPPPSAALRAGGLGPAVAGSSTASSVPGGLPGSTVAAPGTGATFGQRRQGFAEAVVFVVGGGSMEEYGNLQDWVFRTSGGRDAIGSGGGAGGSGGAGDHGTSSRSGASAPRRRVVYGSTELLSPNEFVRDELERLGREIGS